jgi:hypothetical protein
MNQRLTERTIYQDLYAIGSWFESDIPPKNMHKEKTVHQHPDQPGYWFENGQRQHDIVGSLPIVPSPSTPAPTSSSPTAAIA